MIARRLAIPAFIAMLAVLLAVMGRNLWLDLEDLSTAGSDNAQWTILQLDSEFANLQAILIAQSSRPDPDLDAIRLRTDLALSRVGLVAHGNAASIISTDARALEQLGLLNRFAGEAATIVDGDMSGEDIARLTELTVAAAPVARQLALTGIAIGAARTEARRKEFSDKLRNTGLVAISVIGVLAAVLVFLNRLLWIAREKDNALRASSRRLESTVSTSLDAIVTSNARGDILDFNPAAEEIFGWKKEELAGQDIAALLPEAVRPAGTNAFGAYLGQGRVEILARRRTGEVFPADLAVTSATAGPDELMIVFLRDISEQKLNEKALIDAKERAERTDRAKSQFLTVMSHEMRTPLNGVLGVLDLLRTTRLSGRQLRYLDVAAASGEVLMRQVNEALDITRIETGSLMLLPQRFNLAGEVSRVTGVLEPLAKEKNLTLTLEIDPGMRMDFVADGTRIGQIITNLVGNAIKFTSRGSVAVTVTGLHTASSTMTTITVRDTGAGIPEEHVEAIFEDFVALSHSSGRMSRGDGLGLSISRKTARLMGGDIKVASVAGQGSEFSLILPLQRATGSDRPAATRIDDMSDRSGAAARVLVVEDNDVSRAILREMLQALGHTVAEAANGSEGRDVALRQGFDVILMDINIPAPDGIELTRIIRASDGPNRNTRIHGLTAYGEEEFLELARSAGMNGYSTKPIRMQDLASILRGEAARERTPAGSPGSVDVAAIDELRGALGTARMQAFVAAFFSETDEALRAMKTMSVTGDRDGLRDRLHKLGGAAALLGLRRLADGAEDLRSELADSAPPALGERLDRLGVLVGEARLRLADLAGAVAS